MYDTNVGAVSKADSVLDETLRKFIRGSAGDHLGGTGG